MVRPTSATAAAWQVGGPEGVRAVTMRPSGQPLLTYGFASSPGCTLAPNAGVSASRSSVTADAVTTTYCYDAADRLVSSTDPVIGASPAYDARGNTTTLGGPVPCASTAPTATTAIVVASGSTATFLRDATNRIIARTEGAPE